MSLKRFVKGLLHRAGYRVFARGWLPLGVEVGEDVARLNGALPPEVCFDVGANVGQTARAMKKWWPQARVHSFEPVRATYEELKRNVADLPGVDPHHVALGTQVQRRTMHLFARSSELSTFTAAGHAAADGTEEVEISTVDEFCQEHGIDRIDLLKTDTEGFDKEVLRGAEQMLRAGRIRCVLTEAGIYSHDARHTPLGELADWMYGLGFHVVGIYDQGSIGRRPWFYCNVLLAHRDLLPAGEDEVFSGVKVEAAEAVPSMA